MHGTNQSAARESRYLSLYARLGVSPNASADAIRLAYQVLAEAYCPDGAYIDGAMHNDLTEIQNAAEILCNPKTRRLYDQGYIDDSGCFTGTGLHMRRIGTIRITGGLLALAGAALLAIGFWPSSKPANSDAQTAALQEHANLAPAKETPPPPWRAADPATAPKPATEPPASHPDGQPQPAPARPARWNRPSQTAAQPSKTPAYLPPASTQPHGQSPRFSSPAERRHRRYARRLERRPREFAEQDTSNLWGQDIWFPHRSAPYYPDDAPPPSTASRSASCLACLADGGDCSGICP